VGQECHEFGNNSHRKRELGGREILGRQMRTGEHYGEAGGKRDWTRRVGGCRVKNKSRKIRHRIYDSAEKRGEM
jgi:hypothetical protein